PRRRRLSRCFRPARPAEIPSFPSRRSGPAPRSRALRLGVSAPRTFRGCWGPVSSPTPARGFPASGSRRSRTGTATGSETPPSAQTGASAISQPGDLVLNGTFRYDKVLPDYATRRVPSDVTDPITSNRERVYRELGDRFEIEVGAKYDLPKGFSLSALYRYG